MQKGLSFNILSVFCLIDFIDPKSYLIHNFSIINNGMFTVFMASFKVILILSPRSIYNLLFHSNDSSEKSRLMAIQSRGDLFFIETI